MVAVETETSAREPSVPSLGPQGSRGRRHRPPPRLGAVDAGVGNMPVVLWVVGAVLGTAGCVLPHGPGVEVGGWWVLSALAAAMAVLVWRAGDRLPLGLQYGQAAAACAAVSVALLCAHHSAAAFGVASLYVLTTVFAASFFETRPLVVYLVGQAAASGALLLTSGLAAAPAAWVVLIGTASTAGMTVHRLGKRLGQAASTDPLTGLPNRRAMERVVVRELARANRRHEPLSLAVIDLDEFKEVNDRLGHAAGDSVLVGATAAWQSQLRAGDVLGRFGGDEFVVLLPGASTAQACAVIDRWRQACSQPFSAGIAAAGPTTPIDELLRLADDACYRAKRRRCGTVVASGGGMVRAASPDRPPPPGPAPARSGPDAGDSGGNGRHGTGDRARAAGRAEGPRARAGQAG